MVNICSWTKGKLCQKKKTNDSLCRRSFPCICTELSEKEENAYKTCMRANVESIPTSSNAAYIRGDSLSISTNTSSFLLTTPLTCDKDKLQSSPTHQVRESAISTAADPSKYDHTHMNDVSFN